MDSLRAGNSVRPQLLKHCGELSSWFSSDNTKECVSLLSHHSPHLLGGSWRACVCVCVYVGGYVWVGMCLCVCVYTHLSKAWRNPLSSLKAREGRLPCRQPVEVGRKLIIMGRTVQDWICTASRISGACTYLHVRSFGGRSNENTG